MWTYAIKRFLMTIPTLLLVSIIVFVLIRLIPGDPAAIMLGDTDSDTALAAMRSKLGLDLPVYRQYLIWVGNIFHGDLGVSINTGEDIASALVSRFAVTAQITFVAVGLATLIAIPAGLIAAWRQNTPLDFGILFVSIVCLSLPSFWLGLMMIYLLAINFGWFPTVGFVSVHEDFVGGVMYLVMPVITLAAVETGVLIRMIRVQTLEILRLDYITHARAKGLSEATVLMRHVFRNSVAPALTVIGLTLGALLGGASVTETVFSIPGLGRLLVDAIFARDYPVLQGCLLFVSFVFVMVNLVVDLLYMLVDPKVKL